MNELELRTQIVETGIELLKSGLVARTWGNVSARYSFNEFLITPSGLDYMHTTDKDLALYDMETDEYTGVRKPSSEKGVHAAAYKRFPDVNFVIHTHQTYASAIGVAGFNYIEMSEEEEEQLGGIALAEYGLPGTKKLKEAVEVAFATGAHTVFMKHHGVVIAGTSKDDALKKAYLLEEICKRCMRGCATDKSVEYDTLMADKILGAVKVQHTTAVAVTTPAVMMQSIDAKPVKATLDDMAQMIGKEIRVVDAHVPDIIKELERCGACFIKGMGGIVLGDDADDSKALAILMDKSTITWRNMQSYGMDTRLGIADVLLMNAVYKFKYSKKKNK